MATTKFTVGGGDRLVTYILKSIKSSNDPSQISKLLSRFTSISKSSHFKNSLLVSNLQSAHAVYLSNCFYGFCVLFQSEMIKQTITLYFES